MKQAIRLDQELKSQVASERKITHKILLTIQTIDIVKSYRELGYPSLFAYLTEEIGYSAGAAQRRIQAARLLKQVPEIAQDLKSGELNLSQVALAQTAIRQEEKAEGIQISTEQKVELLEQLKCKNTFETQKLLKQELPSFEIPIPKAIPVADQKIQTTLQFEGRDWERIQNLMAHFSHSVPDQKLESLLLYWCNQVEAKKQKQKERVEKQEAQASEQTNAEVKLDENLSSSEISLPKRKWALIKRKPISQKIKMQLMVRAHERCEFVADSGKRCNSKHFLEDEHIIPVSKGGTNDLENLRIYCRTHNQLAAKDWGISW